MKMEGHGLRCFGVLFHCFQLDELLVPVADRWVESRTGCHLESGYSRPGRLAVGAALLFAVGSHEAVVLRLSLSGTADCMWC